MSNSKGSTIQHIITIISCLTAVYTSYRLYKDSKSKSKTVNPPKTKNGIEELIGNTPLVKIKSLSK